MAILHLVQYSLPEIASGYTLRTQAIVREQRALGLDPIVVTSPRHPEGDETEIDGVRHYRCRPEARRGFALLRDARRVHHLADRVIALAQARGDVRVLHAHSPVLCGMAALRAGRQLRLPIVYEVRGLWEEAMLRRGAWRRWLPRYRLARAMEVKVCRRADAVVAISRGLQEEFTARGVDAGRISVIPNGVDLDRFLPEVAPGSWREQHGIPDGPLILYLGALRDYEGVGLLLEAFPLIQRQHRKAQLAIVGGGEARERVGARANALCGVHLLAPIPPDETPRAYAAADLVVYPRLSDRATERVTPLKPLEAMAMGKAIVASDVGGLRELLTDGGSAHLFPAGSVAGCAEACARLLGNAPERQRLGRAAREVAARHDWQAVVRSYREVYRTAAASLS